MIVALRLVALLGTVAHGVSWLVARLLPVLPQRVPGALLVALLLLGWAWLAFDATRSEIAARPEPSRSSVSQLVAGRVTGWVSLTALVSGPHLDNTVYATDEVFYQRVPYEPHDRQEFPDKLERENQPTVFALQQYDGVLRYFYVLRDPADPAVGLVARSPRDADAFRTRTITARLVEPLSEPGGALIDEVATIPSDVDPVELRRAAPGDMIRLTGSFGEAQAVGDGWEYAVVSEDGTPVRVRSPHPPHRLPVELSGLATTDTHRMGIVLAEPAMEEALAGVEHPPHRLFIDGAGPNFPTVSYIAPVSMVIGAILLLASHLVGFPVFQRLSPKPASGRRPVVGEELSVEADGLVPVGRRTVRLHGTPASIAWLEPHDYARRAWQLRSLDQALPDAPRLVLQAPDDSLLLELDPLRAELRVEHGRLITPAAVHPALRLRGPHLSATLSCTDEEQCRRIAVELDPATAAPVGERGPEMPAAAQPSPRTWPRIVTSAALAGVGFALLASGAVGVAGAILGGSSDAAVTGGQLVGAVALLGLAWAVLRRLGWVRELLPGLATIGLLAAVLVAVAVPSCGTWLQPAVAGCAAWSPLALTVAIAAAGGFALVLTLLPRLGREQRI